MSSDGANAPTPRDVDTFLATFFSSPNELTLGAVSPTGKAKHLAPWVDRLRGVTPRPTVLPSWRGGRVFWYGLAFSETQLDALGDQLLAFVGPTHSTFRGHRAVLDPADPTDAAVLLLTRGFAVKFTGPLDVDQPKPIWLALELMRAVGTRRPEHVLELPRPTGRVLRDFYMALRARRGESAEAHLRYLAEHRRLTPSNILFLRVWALAELGEWEAVLARSELPDLLQMRRPVAVTEALLRAVYRQELASFEQTNDIDGALAHFREIVLPKYGTLFLRYAGIRAPDAVKALMLLAVAAEPADPGLRDALWATRGLPEEDRLYLKLLADRLHSPASEAPADPFRAASESWDRGDYEGAYVFARGAPPTAARATLLVKCAYELQSVDAEREAIAAVGALSDHDRVEALRGRGVREIYERLTELSAADQSTGTARNFEDAIPANWIDWLKRVDRDETWTGGLDVARRGALEWDIEELLALPRAIARLAELLVVGGTNVTVQNALPHLLTFFERDALWPRPELAPAYLATLDVLAIGSEGADDDLRVYARLAEAVLELGTDPKEYDAIVSGAHHLLVDRSAPSHVQWGLELLEAMVVHPCPDETKRLDLLLDVVALVHKHWRRIDDAQRAALRLLCEDVGQLSLVAELSVPPSTAGPDAPPNVLAGLTGKTVAIYTLTKRAGAHFARILTEQARNVTVHLSHDAVGTDRLRNLARRADIFIMVTGSAKHAATKFIEDHRPSDRPLLRPSGKGVGSMLQVLGDFLRSRPARDVPLAS